jgi:hypothetical protein
MAGNSELAVYRQGTTYAKDEQVYILPPHDMRLSIKRFTKAKEVIMNIVNKTNSLLAYTTQAPGCGDCGTISQGESTGGIRARPESMQVILILHYPDILISPRRPRRGAFSMIISP